MKLYKGYYFVNAMKQPNEIYPVDALRIESCYDKWGVCEIHGTISDELRQTVNSIDIDASDPWFLPFRTSTRYYATTSSEPAWCRSITRQLSGTMETVPMVPVYLPVNMKPYGIKKVIFHDPATIVLWEDGTKTVVKCQEGDTYSKEIGLAMCMLKKYMGNESNFNNVFKKYCGGDEDER